MALAEMIIPRALYITVCENELYCTVKKTEYTHCSFSQLLQLSQVHKKMVCMSISIVTGSDITLARTLLPSTSVVTVAYCYLAIRQPSFFLSY